MSENKSFASPEDAAKALASGKVGVAEGNPQKSTNQSVCLTVLWGPLTFYLKWDAEDQAFAPYDWVGLYPNTDDATGYVDWSWADQLYPEKDTNVPLQAGYEARYLVWDDPSKQYVIVARTGPYPNNPNPDPDDPKATICSSSNS